MGEIIVSGKIGALLELGAGFHPEFTGRENIYLSGATMGFSKVEIEQAASEIIEFSGIGNFVEKPVKTYSSGMLMRLAFSIATCVRPEILIIDEVLSVGDQEFFTKMPEPNFGIKTFWHDHSILLAFNLSSGSSL